MINKHIEVTILNQIYHLSCSSDSESKLVQASILVDKEMSKIQCNSNIRGIERIAVTVALSLAMELIKLKENIKNGKVFPVKEIKDKINNINKQIKLAIQHSS